MLLTVIITSFIVNLLIVASSGVILDYVLKGDEVGQKKLIAEIASSFCVGTSILNVILLSLAWYYSSKLPSV